MINKDKHNLEWFGLEKIKRMALYYLYLQKKNSLIK